MIKVGDKVRFDCLKNLKVHGLSYGSKIVKGEVVEMHGDHHWFGVKYSIDGNTSLRTSFNFADIDVTVFPCR